MWTSFELKTAQQMLQKFVYLQLKYLELSNVFANHFFFIFYQLPGQTFKLSVSLIWMRSTKLWKGSENNGLWLVSNSRKYTGLIITTADKFPGFIVNKQNISQEVDGYYLGNSKYFFWGSSESVMTAQFNVYLRDRSECLLQTEPDSKSRQVNAMVSCCKWWGPCVAVFSQNDLLPAESTGM